MLFAVPTRWESWILDSGQLLYVRQGAVAVLMYVHEGGRVQKTMKDDSSHTRQKPRRPPTCASVQNNVYESEDSDAMMDGPCPSHQITTLRSILIPGRKLRTGRKVGRGRFFLPYLLIASVNGTGSPFLRHFPLRDFGTKVLFPPGASALV